MRNGIFSVTLCLALIACQSSSRLPEYELNGATMGTTFNVKIVAPPGQVQLDALQVLVEQALTDIENLASTYIEESQLSQFNRNSSTNWVGVSPELCYVVATALALSRQTNGAFDITVGPLVNLWGFGPKSIRDEPPSDLEVDALLRQVGFQKLQADCDQPALRKQHADLYVDLSAWAKGFASDQLAAILIAHAIDNYLVEVGGELRVQGHNAESKDWAVAIEKPVSNGREVQSILRITDTGMATSGDYRNYFEHNGQRYSHTIDPRSGRPISHSLASVTVFDTSAAKADGLATALLVLGPEEGPAMARQLGVHAQFSLRTPQGFDVLTTPARDQD